MDAVKIIKKHGSPGGLPVVTAYVDADAPGEEKSGFLQRVLFTTGFELYFYTANDTPLTIADIGDILFNNGFTSSSTGLSIDKSNTPAVANDGALVYRDYRLIWGVISPTKTAKVVYTSYSVVIQDGVFARTASTTTIDLSIKQIFIQKISRS